MTRQSENKTGHGLFAQPPSPADALFAKGRDCMREGHTGEAEDTFREALRLRPAFAEAHANLGLLLEQRGMAADAEAHYRQAILHDPRSGEAHLNLGALLIKAKRLEEAQAHCRQAVDLLPGDPAAWLNLGALQTCRKEEAAAEESLRRAIAIDPTYRLASFNLAYLLLRQGRFEEGWQCLEARDWYARLEQSLPCPRWRGEPLAGKSLLIGLEAGHGDMIQFGRYAAVLKKTLAPRHITILCHPALKTLFKTLDGVDAVFGADETIPDAPWDFWTPPLSLPYCCATRLDSILADLPYLHADGKRAEHWSSIIDNASDPSDLRVGLVWKGNPLFESDADRSLPGLETLLPLGAVAGVRLFSLQKGMGEEEAANPPKGLELIDLGREIKDFADLAAIMVHLDLVISVDTAAAHLAGALARPCWVLLPDYRTDWRWLTDRIDSPWYPGVMSLFRQGRDGNWRPVIAEVARALAERAKAHKDP